MDGQVLAVAAHEVPQRGAAAQVFSVRPRLQDASVAAEPRQHAHGHQAAPLQTLSLVVHDVGRAGAPRALPPHARETAPLHRVRLR